VYPEGVRGWSRVSKPAACATAARPADWEVGDTAGLETCATRLEDFGLRWQPAEAKRSEDWSTAATPLFDCGQSFQSGVPRMLSGFPPQFKKIWLRLGGFALNRVVNSIHQHQHRRVLCRLDHILKLPVSRDWFFEFGGNCRHGFEDWEGPRKKLSWELVYSLSAFISLKKVAIIGIQMILTTQEILGTYRLIDFGLLRNRYKNSINPSL
jgi:hypothetical protein